eukprot:m.288417 g.288417  ORF g.288417 m.288417 type:complete len:110 (-) comp19960_c0_seq13:220-549(-)
MYNLPCAYIRKIPPPVFCRGWMKVLYESIPYLASICARLGTCVDDTSCRATPDFQVNDTYMMWQATCDQQHHYTDSANCSCRFVSSATSSSALAAHVVACGDTLLHGER